MEPGEVARKLSLQERKVLLALRGSRKGTPEELQASGLFRDTVEVMNGASWLNAKGLVAMKERLHRLYALDHPGVAEGPLPERRALEALGRSPGSTALEVLGEAAGLQGDELSVALGWLRRKGWAEIHREPGGNRVEITEIGRQALHRPGPDEVVLQRLAKGEAPGEELDPQVVTQLKGRQDLIREREQVRREIALTPDGEKVLGALLEILPQRYGLPPGEVTDEALAEVLQRMEREEVAELTPELLQSGRWREVGFRRYDVKAFAPAALGGKAHPVSYYVEKIRRIFTEMGFTELRGDYIEPAFWTFDALFQPQDHPARNEEDTFYLGGHSEEGFPPDEVVRRVAAAHGDGGGTGSRGWGYRWSREEATRRILRTHTTGLTIRHLYEHPDPPVKAFAIGRVFRRDAVDWKHLPQFTQVEGVVMEEGANLSMLIGLLTEFYTRMGFEKVRVRPGYFPYTEPSLEPEVWFNGQWMELGGSGIFRPEVTQPLGIKAPVVAWGLGLERMILAVEGINDIRKLVWNDLDWLRQARVGR